MLTPYVGVTGITAPEELWKILPWTSYIEPRLLMIGVLATTKTLAGLRDKKHPMRFPGPITIPKLFPNSRNTLNLLHIYLSNFGSLSDQLESVKALCGHRLHGFQLNIKWPDPRQLQKFRQRNPSTIIVLQLGAGAMRDFWNNAKVISQTIEKDYKNLIDHVLIDFSGGNNTVLEPQLAKELILAIQQRCPDLNIGVAGGLTAKTLEVIKPLLKIYPRLSWDTEGGMRPYSDLLDLDEVQAYLKKSGELSVNEKPAP